jgi:hypothetical protein
MTWQARFMVQMIASEVVRAYHMPAATVRGAFPWVCIEMQKHPFCRQPYSISTFMAIWLPFPACQVPHKHSVNDGIELCMWGPFGASFKPILKN